MIAICARCRWLSDTAKGMPWTRWYCMQAVNDEVNYVSGEVEAYHLCRFVNKNGACSMFEAGPNCLKPKEP
jgi:hypothetical protein